VRTLIEAEIASRDASNTRARLKAAAFSVVKTIEGLDLTASIIPAPTLGLPDFAGVVRREGESCSDRAGGPGESHALIAIGHAAVHAGHRVRYFTAPDLVETLYGGLADNSVGKTIDTLLGNDLVILDEVGFAPLDDIGTQLLFRLVAAAYERRSLAIASHWSFEDWGRFLPQHTTVDSLLDRLLHHATNRGHQRTVLPDARSPNHTRRTPEQELINRKGWDFYLANGADFNLAIDNSRASLDQYVMSAACHLVDARGCDGHTEFVVLDFLRHCNLHVTSP
jgi:hypothetical protein